MVAAVLIVSVGKALLPEFHAFVLAGRGLGMA